MLLGFGWCVLRSSREVYQNATIDSVDDLDDRVNDADVKLWNSFKKWLAANDEVFVKWRFHDQVNNHKGLFQFCVSRNHRSSVAWDMLKWIAENGPGSFGLFYVHDDEDQVGVAGYGRGDADFSNEFRVHRMANGELTELPDTFLSPIIPRLNPNKLA